MKKIVIPLLLGLFATIPHHLPAASYKSIIVNQSDGSEMKVTIEDDMKTAVAEGNLVITCTKGDIVLPVIDIKNWTFSTSAGSDDVWTGNLCTGSVSSEIFFPGSEWGHRNVYVGLFS